MLLDLSDSFSRLMASSGHHRSSASAAGGPGGAPGGGEDEPPPPIDSMAISGSSVSCGDLMTLSDSFAEIITSDSFSELLRFKGRPSPKSWSAVQESYADCAEVPTEVREQSA